MFFNPKQIEWLFAETIFEQEDGKDDISGERQNDQDLGPGGLLNGLPVFYLANFAWTVLRFFFVDQGVKFASQTDPESRFEEEEDQADETNKSGDGAVGVDHYQQDEHGQSQNDTDDPGKFLLFGANIFGRLVPDDQTADDQGRGKSGTHQYPN